jgi:transketolase
VSCDGHDPADITRAIDEALADDRPSLVSCKTIIGKGAPTKQGTSATHGSALGAEEVAAAREYLGWTAEPFVVPEAILADWRSLGEPGKRANAEWSQRLAASDRKAEFEGQFAEIGRLAAPALADHFAALAKDPPKVASRKASEMALGPLTETLPQLIGGSADLTGSNNTKTASTKPLTKADYSGRYLYYGIREFGMAAAMNGMALHGGVVPYGGTFLIFSDYARNAIRLSALQKVRVVYVLTHDSIGLGEDGPTHQPVEQVMSLRLVPNLNVYRPADAIETAECWALALATPETPSVLALSRQNLPPVRADIGENRSARGAYRLRAATAARKAVLVATGSEVSIAVDALPMLKEKGISAKVVSVPSVELFLAQSDAYRSSVIGSPKARVAVEAGIEMGWAKLLGEKGRFVGMHGFGASGPAEKLYEHFGITPNGVVEAVTAQL